MVGVDTLRRKVVYSSADPMDLSDSQWTTDRIKTSELLKQVYETIRQDRVTVEPVCLSGLVRLSEKCIDFNH